MINLKKLYDMGGTKYTLFLFFKMMEMPLTRVSIDTYIKNGKWPSMHAMVLKDLGLWINTHPPVSQRANIRLFNLDRIVDRELDPLDDIDQRVGLPEEVYVVKFREN